MPDQSYLNIPSSPSKNDIFSAWQERVFFGIFSIIILVGIVPYISSSLQVIHENKWGNLIVYTIAYICCILIVLVRRIPFHLRVMFGLGTFYFIGLTALISIGPLSSGRIWLFAFSILASLLLGMKAGLITLIINASTFLILGYFLTKGQLEWALEILNPLKIWIVISITFVSINTIITISLALLVRALEQNLLQEQNSTVEFTTANVQLKHEIIERKQAEEINKALFSVSNAINTTQSLKDLFKSIHNSISGIIDVTNFYIAMVDIKKGTLKFPYHVDTSDDDFSPITNFDPDNSLTGLIVSKRKPILLKKNELEKLSSQNNIWGPVPLIWMGVPLLVKDEIIGVVAVQSYQDSNLYNEQDLQVLSGVSDQIAIAIDRKQAEDALINSEKKLLDLSNQTEQLSLAAASMISMKEEQEIFSKISKSIVEFSDFKRVIISLFKEKAPFRDIVGFGGVEEMVIDKLRKVEMPKNWYDKVFVEKNIIGHNSYYIPHTKKNILNQEATIYGSGPVSDHENKWHPEDNLFVKMNDGKGNVLGVISVDDSKSELIPTLETVRPLEIFSSLISQIVILKKEQKEKKIIETQLQQAQKMESIGTLAGGIAHDFNNILFPVLGHTEMLLQDIPEDNPIHNNLKKIYKGANRAKELVRQILTFSRQEKSELMLLKLQPVIKEALKLLRATIPTTIEIMHDINPNCGGIKADPTQIHQIVMNLTTNAYHAMEETGGILKISLKQIESGKDSLKIPDLKPGAYACLTISDTGAGIDDELTDKIFEPFFTTKEVGKGTGMGLSVVHGIVKSMNGTINVYSEPDRGTEFNVYFLIEKSSYEKQEIQTNEVIPFGTEHILFVDDEEEILTMEKKMLERLGYKVTSRISSIDALEAFRAAPGKFDMVITDMAMPNMPGDKLSVELTKIRPDIPVVICTGFSETMSEEKAVSLGINGFLFKPIVMKDLSHKIREVLDKK